MASSGMLHRVALVRTDISEQLSASFIRVTRIGELGTTLAATSNRRTQRSYLNEKVAVLVWKTEISSRADPLH
jgi:S-adenosylmethionine:diacylglycerol 3-amino-3-carboxypropyl transferase